MDEFTGKDLALQKAIDADSAEQVTAALRAGAGVNAKGAHGVTPLEYAIGHFKKAAFAELLRHHANPNQRDDEKDNAVTLAASAFARDPSYLLLVLKAGGDPNTRRPDNDPVLVRFIHDRNLEGIRTMKANGADLDLPDRNNDPMILVAGVVEYWDVVWCLLELGARYNYPESRYSWPKNFSDPRVTPPDSPLYSSKVKVWRFLKEHGVQVPKTLDSQ